MHRRSILVALAAAVGGVGWVARGKQIPLASISTANRHENYPMTQNLSGGFDRLEWHDDGSMTVHFNQEHDMDGFGALHRANDDFIDEDLFSCAAPTYGGSVSIPFIDILLEIEATFPNNKFTFVGATGTYSECGTVVQVQVVGNQTTTAPFVVPESLMPS